VPRAREKRELVVGRHAAAGEPVEEHGQAQLLGEREQRALAVPPVEVRAGHDHGALGLAQHRDRAIELAAVGLRAGGRVGQHGALVGLLGLGEDEVEREVEKRGARVWPQRGAQRVVDEAPDLGG
jgi:hypothetical protein